MHGGGITGEDAGDTEERDAGLWVRRHRSMEKKRSWMVYAVCD
jgi:hypothetical protein